MTRALRWSAGTERSMERYRTIIDSRTGIVKPLVWIGIAMVICWGVLWLGVKMAIGAVHLLLLLGVVLIGWGLLQAGSAAAKN